MLKFCSYPFSTQKIHDEKQVHVCDCKQECKITNCPAYCNPRLFQIWWWMVQIVLVIHNVAITKMSIKWFCELKYGLHWDPTSINPLSHNNFATVIRNQSASSCHNLHHMIAFSCPKWNIFPCQALHKLYCIYQLTCCWNVSHCIPWD